MHSQLNVKLKSIIDIPLLKRIVELCDFTYVAQIFKALYLLSFYSSMRLSDLVPHTEAQFSPLKHLARSDVILRPEKLILILKRLKTMQTNNQIKLIRVPGIQYSTICPVVAVKKLLDLTPRGSNLPLLQFKVAQDWIPLTDTRRHFAFILAKLGLSHSGFTFHTSNFQVPPLLLIMM